MGEHLGVTAEEARRKTEELQNICLYCDHFFTHHMQEFNPGTYRPLPVVG
jgi:hypothetical protein